MMSFERVSWHTDDLFENIFTENQILREKVVFAGLFYVKSRNILCLYKDVLKDINVYPLDYVRTVKIPINPSQDILSHRH